ncbi:MAG: hypothetical protein HC890_09225 [Chloroflexaceae bacterium]|nr:hypothetical protein [Chloroflexaceae bacterium]
MDEKYSNAREITLFILNILLILLPLVVIGAMAVEFARRREARQVRLGQQSYEAVKAAIWSEPDPE